MAKHTSYPLCGSWRRLYVSVAVLDQKELNMVAGASGASTSPLPIHNTRAPRAHSSNHAVGVEGADHWILLAGALAQWRRIVRKLWRIRRLQRYWGHLGQWLQQVASKELRESLRKQLP